jgi:hypothetical protein
VVQLVLVGVGHCYICFTKVTMKKFFIFLI